MTKISLALAFAWFSSLAYACDGLNMATSLTQSPNPYNISERCIAKPELTLKAQNNDEHAYSFSKEAKQNYSDYWADWVLQTETNPFLSGQFANNYVGVGVWAPDNFTDFDDYESMQDWMMNHGLQFSVGFGEKRVGEPRLRFDYLWHENEQDQMLMQLEVPF